MGIRMDRNLLDPRMLNHQLDYMVFELANFRPCSPPLYKATIYITVRSAEILVSAQMDFHLEPFFGYTPGN